ncbi:hypothetical protein PPL_12111 [Heterostelium album PN500]|uniref:Uncharacterized protein n=1 Tax=Heterostelium pallidum (strain ATCC 26659 / Pp 5 / PN500) TaxID=670386 RepID=D3BLQ8_HETP5|nr:hypothetical protein PPL_12111 [Heterostelium album PN500]EFA77509.1 hypothetical protein PPL_12111 [Heterostelium album PN500]|eukprot:XP_020429637.1 hypothetical protein PPL_12111 [Heterostelium album PN500]
MLKAIVTSDATTTYLTNVTVNSDATFSGSVALYNGTPKRMIGYTTIKGVLSNPFNLIIIYNPAPSLHFPGSTDYYNLVSCSKSLKYEESDDTLTSTGFEKQPATKNIEVPEDFVFVTQ